ncbi:MAG: hypothetical protein NTW06_03590 [Candidatus Falkowbacteria bacterium]|nr:hypothetical protein [Candidatus Falkowbacteria bacterium]
MINKKIASVLIVGIVLLLAIMVMGLFYQQILKQIQISNKTGNQQACTQEAKLCDDGSSVGRTGPNCEFARCSEKNNSQAEDDVTKFLENALASENCQDEYSKNSCFIGKVNNQCGDYKNVKINDFSCRCLDANDCPPCPEGYACEDCFQGWICEKDETTNWQTYSNDLYGFKIKYPPEWESTVSNNPFMVEFNDSNDDNEIDITIGLYNFTSQGSLEKNIEYLNNSGFTNGYQEIPIIGGRGFYGINEALPGPVPTIYLVSKSQILLMDFLSSLYDPSRPKESLVPVESLFKKFIATFKFISTTTKETAEFFYNDPQDQFIYTKSEFNVIDALSKDILEGDEPRNLSSFSKEDKGVTYEFSYKNPPDYGYWTASVVANKPQYKNTSEFEKAFPVSGVGYNFFPEQVSEKYLLFASGCGGAALEGEIDKCGDLQSDIGNSIVLK